MTANLGTIEALWRFPVKSMLGERLERADISQLGLVGDRAYALYDRETGKRVSAVDVRRYPNLFQFSASFGREPKPGEPVPPVVIELPDGNTVDSEDPAANQAISDHLGREVELVRADGENGAHHDAFPVSVLTNSTLRQMSALQPGSVFDARRFRMNVIVEWPQDGFPENDWVGKEVTIGERVRLEIVMPDARCIMTTLPQQDLPHDRTILAGLVRHNRLPIGDKGRYPCAGVYAKVSASGAVTAGEPVSLGQT